MSAETLRKAATALREKPLDTTLSPEAVDALANLLEQEARYGYFIEPATALARVILGGAE